MSKKNTLIFLMDICGHEGLCDEFAQRYRTYALQDIINDAYVDRENCVIASTHFLEGYVRSEELWKQATLDRGWSWIKVQKTENFSVLGERLKDVGFDLSAENTNIIYGGTNTSGCVLNSSSFSLNKFCERGYSCQLYLPLCDDGQIAGINGFDKSQKAFARLYQYIKKENYIPNIDILTSYAELIVPRSDKRYDYIST